MPTVRSLIETAQARGLRLFLAEGKVKVQAQQNLDENAKALIEELREHKEEIKSVLDADLTLNHITSTFFTEDKSRGWLVLVVRRSEKLPTGPITIVPSLRIVDVAKFTESTIRDLETYVATKNRGSNHWVDRVLDEKIEQLERCGVKAEIRELQ